MSSRLLRRAAAALAVSVALVSGGLVTAAPASALSPVTYTVDVPDRVWVGQWIDLGLACPSTCPIGVLDATVSIAGGPTLELPAEPDYTTSWQVDGVTAGDDDGIVTHVVTVSFTDETGSARTLTKTVRFDKDNPQQPENVSVTDGDSAQVTWDAPLIDGGSPITNYYVEVDGSGQWKNVAAADRLFSLSGWPTGPHTVRVVPVNYYGWGSSVVVTVVKGVMPPAPSVSISGTTAPTVSWAALPSTSIKPTAFAVYADGYEVARVAAGATSVTLTSLDPGPQDITVAALTTWGPSTESSPVTWVQPSAPSAVDTPAVAPAVDSLSVSWNAPSSDGGLAVSSYLVRALDPATRTVLSSTTATGTSTTITGLIAGAPYLVSVAAKNAMGTSGWTDAADAVAPTGSAVASSLTAKVSTSSPTTTTKVYVSGVLTVSGKVETGQKVSVFVKPAGAASWTLAGTATAGSTGAWSFGRVFSSTTAVQARFFGSTSLDAKPAASAPLTVAPSVSVTARSTTTSGASRTTFKLGSTVLVPVVAVAAPAGAKATLQRKYGTRWITITSATVVSGKARLTWKPASRATFPLRVVVGGSSTVKTGYSRAFNVRIY
ncbi:MAG: fibronectin type III domain-containing protein [Actinobacteria bacterium]|nr:fibronectin type III domain-containing protein [Actinomycetota bacterium]